MKPYQYITLMLILFLSMALSQAQSTEVTETTDSVPLSLNEVMPESIPAGQESTVTIRGTGFEAETSISLTQLGTVPTTVIDSTTLTISLPDTLAAGTYHLNASNSDGSISSTSPSIVIETLVASPSPIVTSAEPQRLQAGFEATISIIGSGFTSDLVVRLEGFGLLPTSFINAGALTAQVPASIAARNNGYGIELINGQGISYPSSFRLQFIAPVQPSQVPPVIEAPPPTEPPQPMTTAPLLQLSSFSVDPASIDAGQSMTLSFTVTNRGNDTARMITVALSANSAFVPAAGQVALALPDIAAGASASGQMAITSSLDIVAGSVLIPLAISYQNPHGESYSAVAELSVLVNPSPNSSQLVIDAYVLEPSPAEAGQEVMLRLTLFNVGETTASQVLLRIGGEGGLLLPNGRGDSVPIGDIEGRQTVPVELSLLVNTNAETGYQVQPIAISYSQNGETHEISSNITINITASTRPQPLLLLNSYDTGLETINPSSRFTLNIELQNAGLADARNMLISFGTLQSSSGGESNSTTGGVSSMTPSTTFAPIGTAGLVFVGDVLSGATVQASQEFMVSGNLASGIYPLPVTLQYLLPDGSAKQDSLNISLVVILPPNLQINPAEPLPETINIGESSTIMLEIKNNGRDVSLLEAVFTSTNGEILEGASIPLEVLNAGEETSLIAMLNPEVEGEVQVSLSLHYKDELNQPQSIVLSYESLAVSPPAIEEVPLEEAAIIYEEPEAEVNWFGQIMMALLGLGG